SRAPVARRSRGARPATGVRVGPREVAGEVPVGLVRREGERAITQVAVVTGHRRRLDEAGGADHGTEVLTGAVLERVPAVVGEDHPGLDAGAHVGLGVELARRVEDADEV